MTETLLPHLGSHPNVLWDWNGTLLDDLDLCHQALSGQLAARGLRALPREEYVERFRFPVRSFYEELGFETHPEALRELSRDFMARYDAGVWSCRLHGGAAETLEALRARGARQAILSAAEERYLRRQVAHSIIDGHFETICGQDDHSAEGKLARGRRFLVESGWLPADTVLVGDTDHDVEVASELGIDVILVTGGHQSAARLRRAGRRVVERRRDGRISTYPVETAGRSTLSDDVEAG